MESVAFLFLSAGAEIVIDGTGCLTSFRDCPDHEGLAAAHVACCKNPRGRCHVIPVGRDIPPGIQHNSEFFKHPVRRRTGESQRKQNEVNLQLEFGIRNRLEFWRRTYTNRMKPGNIPAVVSGKTRRRRAPFAYPPLFMGAFIKPGTLTGFCWYLDLEESSRAAPIQNRSASPVFFPVFPTVFISQTKVPVSKTMLSTSD